MQNRNIIVYDLQIARAIMPRFTSPEPGIKYCSGWDDFDNMGISIIGTYDYRECRSRAFLQNNLAAFEQMLTHYDFIVGFNNHQFADRLLTANGITLPKTICSYDLYLEICHAAELEMRFGKATETRLYLEQLADANLVTGGAW